jgi:tol-pal system protein YbgF
MNQFRMLLFLLIIAAGLLFLSGCASSGQTYDRSSDEMADIDALLGLDESSDESIGENEVLEMLGIAEQSAMDSEFQELGSMEESQSGEINNEVQYLESQQNQLDLQTRDLQQKIADQESQIAALETSKPPTGSATSLSAFNQAYQTALETYRARHYQQAIEKFEVLLSQNRNHSLSDNAQYWIGESYYGLGNYQKAITAFEKVFTFSNSNKDDAAQLKLGLCYMKLNDNAKAREELEKLITDFPASESVGLARRLLNQIQTTP